MLIMKHIMNALSLISEHHDALPPCQHHMLHLHTQPAHNNAFLPPTRSSPMGFIFYLAIINNIFSICGLAGVLNAQRELVIGFFGYNAAQMIISFHYFVDMCTDANISYTGEPKQLSGFEKAAAAFIFFNFLLSVAATTFAVKALDEIKAKQREEYNRLTVLSDTLQYEADQ